MKKLISTIIYWTFLVCFAFPQHNREAFRISMEENWHDNQPNLESKCDIERLLSGDFNAPVEFFYLPAEESRGVSPLSFRIVMDSLNLLYIAEVRYITHFDWSQRYYPEVLLRPSRLVNISFPVSRLFAEKLHERMQKLISTFEEENPFPEVFAYSPTLNRYLPEVAVVVGGHTETFRTVVDDEVWSLWIHMPQNKALEFSTLFKQMIEDARAGEFDEERYMEMLNAI